MGFDLQMVRAPASADIQELPNSGGVPGYYRFNTWGMKLTLGALEWADAIHYAQAPTFPPFPPAGVDVDRAYAALERVNVGPDDETYDDTEGDDPPTDAEIAAVRIYKAARDAVAEASSIIDGQVGAYKLVTNDAWLVTPEECRILAARLREHVELIARDFFPDAGVSVEDGRTWLLGFARYNELAAEHGGYRVY
ncbi:MAG: hypothetical protein R3B09_28745 [Nannocystaceae bacterium]